MRVPHVFCMGDERGKGKKDLFVKAIFDSILHTKVRGNANFFNYTMSSREFSSLSKNLNKIESSPAPKDSAAGQ